MLFFTVAMETKLGDWWHSNESDWQVRSEKPSCGCLPACFSIQYNKIETSSELSTHYKVKNEYTLGRDPAYFK